MRRLLFFITCLTVVSSLSAQPSMRAILVCCTKDDAIGKGCQRDLERVNKMMQRCAELLSW